MSREDHPSEWGRSPVDRLHFAFWEVEMLDTGWHRLAEVFERLDAGLPPTPTLPYDWSVEGE